MKPKLIRITTVPISLEKLLEGQLGFMKQQYEVTAVSSDKKQLKKFGNNEGVAIFCVPLTRKISPFKDLQAVWRLYKFLRKESPQIVHTHTPKAGIVGMLAAYMAKIPNRLHTVAGLPLLETTGFKRKILNLTEKATYRFATKVYPNSKGLYDIIISEKFTYPKKLKIIENGSSNGIDTNYFSSNHFTQKDIACKKKELKLSSQDFVFIFVGRIVKDKGINELVKAFVRLNKQHKNCSLLLIGPFEDALDPISKTTKKYISENSKIIVTGYQKDVRIFFLLSNALVFPSYREGFPNVVMQAGAMGLPSIVTNINGCNEIVKDGKNGLIIPPKNVEALFQKMQLLLLNSDLTTNLGLKSRKMIINRYERSEVWNAILKEYNDLFLV